MRYVQKNPDSYPPNSELRLTPAVRIVKIGQNCFFQKGGRGLVKLINSRGVRPQQRLNSFMKCD